MYSILEFFDKLVGFLNGFGFGAVTIKTEVRSARKLLKHKVNFVIDCGGNKGLYTDELLRINATAQIVIFEPSKVNIDHLNQRFKNNTNVDIIGKAVSNQPGELFLYSEKAGSGLASLANRKMNHFDIDFSTKEIVAVTTIDNEIKNSNIDILKMDIEGYELAALKGATETLKRTKLVQFEFGGANIDTRTFFQDFFYFFQENNFSLWRITPIGLKKINRYNESMERFVTSNYIAVNNKIY